MRLGSQVNVLSRGTLWVSPTLQAVATHPSLQYATPRVRTVPRLTLDIRSPIIAETEAAADVVETGGATLAIEASLYALWRLSPSSALYARVQAAQALLSAELLDRSERTTSLLIGYGVAAGVELGPALLTTGLALQNLWSTPSAPEELITALEGVDLELGVIVRLSSMFWLFAETRPVRGSLLEDGHWMVGAAAQFFPLDDDD